MENSRIDDVGKWFLVTLVKGTQQLLLRLRVDRPNVEDIGAFTHVIAIKWVYPSQPGTVAPTDAILKQMHRFEETLSELSFMNGSSYLMNVGTGSGLREWVYYAKDRNRSCSD